LRKSGTVKAIGQVVLVFFAAMIVAAGPTAQANPYVLLGPADPLAVDQPRVAVEVYDESGHSFGPAYFNTMLLDTAAQGLMAVGAAVDEMVIEGYQTSGALFAEQGIGGSTDYDVSEIYHLNFAGSSGAPQTLDDVRLLSNSEIYLGSFNGIIGMPGMVNRITTLDMTAMLGGEWGIDFMGVEFPSSVPADAGHRYRFALNLVDFPPTGQQNPDDPLPTYAPLPFVQTTLQNGGNTTTAGFAVDTGAQLSLLSTSTGLNLGLDSNGDNQLNHLDDAYIDDTDLMGVGGSVTVPVFAVEQLRLVSQEGLELVWTDLQLPIYDIDPNIGGVFGCELLTSGWLEGVFVTGEYGYIEQVHFDFTDAAGMNGMMLLDLNPDYDRIAGDFNGDRKISDADFVIWADTYRSTTDLRADGNHDGQVTDADYTLWADYYGYGLDGSVAVPEPATLALLALGAVLLLIRRRPRPFAASRKRKKSTE